MPERTRSQTAHSIVAEGVGFEPTTPLSQGKRLAGARTRPLCDPSVARKYITKRYVKQRIMPVLRQIKIAPK